MNKVSTFTVALLVLVLTTPVMAQPAVSIDNGESFDLPENLTLQIELPDGRRPSKPVPTATCLTEPAFDKPMALAINSVRRDTRNKPRSIRQVPRLEEESL